MDIKYKSKVNKKIGEILNLFVGAQNDDKTRGEIGYELTRFLEIEGICFETVNLYTTPERVDQCLIDIRVDDELYPFSEIEKITEDNWFDFSIKWEDGELNFEDTIKLFQYLIDEGHAWSLQGFYKRTAEELIQEGYCTLSYKETVGKYIWGSTKIPSKNDLKTNAPGTDEYVQKRKELGDEEFFEWSNIQMSEE